MKHNAFLLFYDDNCPLCVWYTNLFVKYDLLAPENRIPFSTADEQTLSRIDLIRATNEIPLLDLANNKTYYGVDALLTILKQRFPSLSFVERSKPLSWFFRKLYALISYNRKVVVAKKCGDGQYDCSPSFNIRYRMLFIFTILACCIGCIPIIHQSLLLKLPGIELSVSALMAGLFIPILLTYGISFALPARQRFDWIGQHAMLGLLSILSLVPSLLIATFLSTEPWLLFISMACAAMFVSKEYIRRISFVLAFKRFPVLIAFNIGGALFFLAYLFLNTAL
ncbi:MAG: DUF393 domain-containing protein [Chitinophagaceae bacterium]|nr:DUF393 domain-containing protein [Chitinophagaceae bacterium]